MKMMARAQLQLCFFMAVLARKNQDARITRVLSFNNDSIASIPNNPVAVSLKSILCILSKTPANVGTLSSIH